ncbi:hypothetical protein Q2B95_08135 [Stenotrophomonas maltophilia]|uniref:hypothetical protein n=1 Tax=Stenotrophomonas maltophilia TaxID=40324 RepID=UPI0030A43D60
MATRKEIQIAVLTRLEEAGKKLYGRELADIGEEHVVAREVVYLKDAGLVDAAVREFDGVAHFAWVSITAKGSDFINKEGTIGAELNVLTVRLHEDTVRDLLVARVRESDADESVKEKLVDQLRALPAQGIAKVAERALDQALRNLPNAVQWLQTVL